VLSKTSVMIPCGEWHLEAMVAEAQGPDVAIVCHPHPLYGGNMDNNAVLALEECFLRMERTTVRFNFRGVGGSTGSYGEGVGETEDLVSVVAHVLERGAERIHMAGYSFGAWVVLNGLKQGLQAASVVLASPPVDFMDFLGLDPPACSTLVVLGDSDSFCSVQSLHRWLDGRQSPPASLRVAILPGCDHFYWGYEDRLAEQVTDFAREVLNGDGSGRSDEPDR
jgi:uncharacterized protein